MNEDVGAPTSSAGMPPPREQVISLKPFVVRRRVTWGECDAAGVVYTPRFGDFSADASQQFIGYVLGGQGYMDGKRRHGIGTPCKAMSLVFHASLRPDQLFDMTMHIGHVGNSTFEVLLAARTLEGGKVFDCSTTLIAIEPSARRAVPLPEAVRALLLPWQDKTV